MRILIAHNRYTQPGGEDNVFEAETALLRQYGHEVYTWEEENKWLKESSKVGAAAATVWSFNSQRKLAGLLDRYQPEVVHFHNTFMRISPAAYYTCQKAGIPVVQTLHNFRLICPAATLFRDDKICEDCLGKWGFWPSIQHRCWHSSSAQTAVVAAMLATHRWLGTWQKQVNFYLVLTEFARQKYIAAGLPAEKIVVKPNFVEPSSVKQSGVRSPFVMFVGRLSIEKGVKLLIKAWKSLPAIPLKIVGDGPMRREVENIIQREGLSHIEVCGNHSRAEVFALMERASLLIVPSVWYEGLPLTIIEAFSRNLPVIAAKLGALAEIVQHGKTGLHFRPNDSSDLIQQVQWAWEHPAEMERLAGNAYEEYLQKYSPAQNYQMLIDIYQRAIAQRAGNQRGD